MGEVLESRRSEAKSRFGKLQNSLGAAQTIAGDKACVYATGSYGREEASAYSDLDLFIVGLGSIDKRKLSNLDEICLKAELIEATRAQGIPEFSGDGEYLKHYTQEELIQTIGKRQDDAGNTFTARLLLLLESKPIIGEGIYSTVIGDVLAAYWRDYKDHRDEFISAFLVNDILRLWRTFCVNYEAGTETEPEHKRAKRRLKNHKLKHSRLLTCYSGLLYLLAVYSAKGSVHPQDAMDMTQQSPTARLEGLLADESCQAAHDTIRQLLEHYEHFLQGTSYSEEDLMARFLDAEKRREYSESSNRLGDLMFQAIQQLGRGNALHRVLMV